MTYRPTIGYSGADSFQYAANDGQLTASATITLLVVPKTTNSASVTVSSAIGGMATEVLNSGAVQCVLVNLPAGATLPNGGVGIDWSQVTHLGPLLGTTTGNPGWVGELLAVGEDVDLAALAQQVGLSLRL